MDKTQLLKTVAIRASTDVIKCEKQKRLFDYYRLDAVFVKKKKKTEDRINYKGERFRSRKPHLGIIGFSSIKKVINIAPKGKAKHLGENSVGVVRIHAYIQTYITNFIDAP